MLIGTGFPVLNTFETDGPVGAIALYQCAEQLGLKPVILCGDPLFSVLNAHYQCYPLSVNQYQHLPVIAEQALAALKPALVLAIERPGFGANGRYNNMRGEDISERCAKFRFLFNPGPLPHASHWRWRQ
ncbi:glutamate cyclase domain-containing protein [Alishewanella longhuensis]